MLQTIGYESLDALIRVPAPSGYETPAAEVWREAASFGDVGADVLGSSTVSVWRARPGSAFRSC